MSITVTVSRAAASGNVPGSFQPGQIGIDEFLGKLFWRQNSGTVAALPMIAPANTLLGNASNAATSPSYLSAAQVLTLTGAAPIASPTFTGTVTIPTLAITTAMLKKAYAIATPIVGGTVVIAAGTMIQILNPVLVLTTLTVTLPSGPADGQTIVVTTTQTINSLTLNGGVILNAPSSLAAGASVEYLFVSSLSTWFRIK